MKEILMIIAVLSVFVYGYFLMAKLDQFLEENHKAITKENEKREPTCVMLSKELSEDEIVEEVRRFRRKHESIRIMLYDSSDIDLWEGLEYHSDRKQ